MALRKKCTKVKQSKKSQELQTSKRSSQKIIEGRDNGTTEGAGECANRNNSKREQRKKDDCPIVNRVSVIPAGFCRDLRRLIAVSRK
jgi:hypothetical protein